MRPAVLGSLDEPAVAGPRSAVRILAGGYEALGEARHQTCLNRLFHSSRVTFFEVRPAYPISKM
jgi:hypothetical protein